jgi:hypothetical protein
VFARHPAVVRIARVGFRPRDLCLRDTGALGKFVLRKAAQFAELLELI